MLSALIFATSITGPIFIVLGCGILFKRIGWVTEEFAGTGSTLVFRVTLPCFLFVKLAATDFRHGLPLLLVGYALAATLLVFLLLDRMVALRVYPVFDRGAFVQGTFRGNMGIVGLAFCISAFGEQVIAAASIYLAVMTVLYNILAIMTLSAHGRGGRGRPRTTELLLGIVKNPLIVAICIGVVVSLANISVPQMLLTTGEYFARMTLPLALLCAGASLRMAEFQNSRALYWATFGKLVAVPLVMTLGGIAMGLRGEQLGILYLMCSSPAAAASHPMTQAFGGNHHLSAAIIAATTLGAMVTTTAGVFILRGLALI